MKPPASSPQTSPPSARSRDGWQTPWIMMSLGLLLFETVSGLAATLAPFAPAVQWGILIHTVAGFLMVGPLSAYLLRHWREYRSCPPSHVTLVGWAGLLAVVVCLGSGVLVAIQAIVGVKTTPLLRTVHLASTLGLMATAGVHLGFALWRQWGSETHRSMRRALTQSIAWTAIGTALCLGLGLVYHGARRENRFPDDYSYLYGTNRPFAPSLARTDTGGAFDATSLAGSSSCGTAGCHQQIVEEWMPSAHRYAAMDSVFLGIQDVMAKQNGPESTRYCGGCHDPISLFSGTKNIFVENLTGLHGYQEGVSCLACHAIRETDIKGNANYVVTQPQEYLWQWATNGAARWTRDFLIRSYPAEHNRLAKRSFKKPEYCAACHKQFIDAEVNRVGWVQLQNQYDNWAASHWNKKGDATKTVECRECHMPLVASTDPAAGDALDYNRNPRDGKHRSHRFIAANTLMPVALKDRLEGWQSQLQLTEQWLRGELPIPEIQDKWAHGPIVRLALSAPESVAPGTALPLRVVMTSNKVGHDFPTGPLDIIQSWLEINVINPDGDVTWSSGKRDAKNFLQPGTFLFKAEPVDQHGNLIDRHNLWEMVGVRFRRALFPGYSDQVQFSIPCSGGVVTPAKSPVEPGVTKNAAGDRDLEIPTAPLVAPSQPGEYRVDVALQYRKVDQFLLNYLFGASNQLTSPVTEIARATLKFRVEPPAPSASLPLPTSGASVASLRP
ncbi:MAG: cytochrome b/b6 domain-containing protein [Verrucomicrobiales bacterium]|nr:cytochrome b/b6 domain-containing protein [Verrucomicrobiales bacterium]